MKRFLDIYQLLSEESDGVDILKPRQKTGLDAPVGENEPSDMEDDVELVNLILAALRIKLHPSQRHFFMGEDFRNKSPDSKLAIVHKLVNTRKSVNEAVGDDEPEPKNSPGEGESGSDMEIKVPSPDEPVPENGMEEETPSETPLEIEDMAETAVRALLEDPDVIRHALQNVPYHADQTNYRDVYKMVKSRLYY